MVHFSDILDYLKQSFHLKVYLKLIGMFILGPPPPLPIGHLTSKLTKIHLTKLAHFTSH